MAASWITPVSRTPPYLAVAIAESRFTYTLLKESREFTVNILDATHSREVHMAGTISGRDYPDKLERIGLKWGKARRVSAPVCLDSLAVAECALEGLHPYGDHVLVVGRILEAYVREGVELVDPKSYQPLLHCGGNKYTAPSEKVVEVED